MRIRDTRAKRDDRNASSLAVRLVDFTASREGGLIYHRRIIYHRKRQSSLSLSFSPSSFPFQPPYTSVETFGWLLTLVVCFSCRDSIQERWHVTRNNEANNESGRQCCPQNLSAPLAKILRGFLAAEQNRVVYSSS